MAALDPIKPEVLSVKVIPKVDGNLAHELKLRADQVSIGMLTVTSDDALYASLDEGTKAANIEIVYAKSFYAGSGYPSGSLSGEVIGIFAAADPSEIESGLEAILLYLKDKAWFFSANENDSVSFFPHVIPSVGYYLAEQARVEPGSPLAYLIAPPIEAMYALDAALKAADVSLKRFYTPPSETNFAGGLLSGDLDDCLAAAEAFQEQVLKVAEEPMAQYADLKSLRPYLAFRENRASTAENLRYSIFGTGERISEKPDYLTHLKDRQLVPKSHPRIEFRGMLDNLQSEVLLTQIIAVEHSKTALTAELEEILFFLRKLLRSEYMNERAPQLELWDLSDADLRKASHYPDKFFEGGVSHATPHFTQGQVAIRLNYLRTQIRLVEQCAARTFRKADNSPTRPDILHALNRLSSVLYVMYCREVAGTYRE